MTKSSSLKGRDTIVGGTIIMPIAMSAALTSMSSTRNGRKTTRSIGRLGHVYTGPPPARRGPDRTPGSRPSRTKDMVIRSLAGMDAQSQQGHLCEEACVVLHGPPDGHPRP